MKDLERADQLSTRSPRELAIDVKALILFYEKRGWGWLDAVEFTLWNRHRTPLSLVGWVAARKALHTATGESE